MNGTLRTLALLAGIVLAISPGVIAVVTRTTPNQVRQLINDKRAVADEQIKQVCERLKTLEDAVRDLSRAQRAVEIQLARIANGDMGKSWRRQQE